MGNHMTRILKSLLGKKKDPTPEETEALDRANFVLRARVERMSEHKAA